MRRANLQGEDLAAHLDDVFRKRARFCVMFASADYARKVWSWNIIDLGVTRAAMATSHHFPNRIAVSAVDAISEVVRQFV
ncbi:hypothetical protein [Actinophytocola sp.]|jgi:hypothetical protein|uniref:hypothetical protein n=1 Tax=Actinophytocola sp. TaxID=1872138 RepID=UPI0039C8BDC0